MYKPIGSEYYKLNAEPTVCCILLTRDRPQMAARAVASFRAQSYERKRLFIYDTGVNSWVTDPAELSGWGHLRVNYPNKTIGCLRNYAIHETWADIIAHWDDDDWSHPNRLAEQVALLQASGADCVGYNEMLFWDERRAKVVIPQIDITCGGLFGPADTHRTFAAGAPETIGGTAWRYRDPVPGHILGTSMMYWRKAWEQHPFDDISHGEDRRFQSKCRVVRVSSLFGVRDRGPIDAPRMIASIHGGNSSRYDPSTDTAMCRRAEEFDGYCAEAMRL
jgi:hypothetical protein